MTDYADFDGVMVRFLHPREDDGLAQMLRAEGLTPLVVNDRLFAGATEDQLQDALDAARAVQAHEPPEALRRMRAAMMAGARKALADQDNAPGWAEDALGLFAHALSARGRHEADTLPFCAAGYAANDLDQALFVLSG